jgi:TetR/AcrR family transcriptional regulator, transcriptional repressor for nem operon
VVRYAKEHKEETRRRILEVSSRRFKSGGVDGSGIAALMADAGLTNGAFYAHFPSKDDLIATVVAAELGAQREAVAALPPGREHLGRLVRSYLSIEHRDHPEEGCPSAALVEEICRGGDRVRAAYTDGILGFVDLIAERLDPVAPQTPRVRVLAAFAGMVGTLQMARTVTDPELSAALLEQGISNALAQLGVSED